MYILKYDADDADSFWTGNRLSNHIAEALRFSKEREAEAEARRVRDQYGINLAVLESWDANDDD